MVALFPIQGMDLANTPPYITARLLIFKFPFGTKIAPVVAELLVSSESVVLPKAISDIEVGIELFLIIK